MSDKEFWYRMMLLKKCGIFKGYKIIQQRIKEGKN